MFEKLLIANRGEIACRVMRTAKRLGMTTVAVYSEADRNAMHVGMADEAVMIGPAPAAESYLKGSAIVEAAKRTGADAVHPGYGFLSENADFAEAVAGAGLTFVGPPAAAIRAMGGKDDAKALMEKADVPVVPGYYGAEQDVDRLRAEAEKIGYPVLLKAAMGGGGKGMRGVASAEEFEQAALSARREAEAAFGDGRMLVEKLLERPRHVEVQIFADSHGNCVHLFERDCSLQRRHQKVIEEAPAPGLSDELRQRMGAAAVAAARAVGYENAGTIEFLLDDDGSFYFMEMNTRLQVEHPVTELITGQDLVEWQLRVAAGEPLPLGQELLVARGHAMEARLYAEDPDNDFLPSPGPVHHLKFPDESAHLRIDTGIGAGHAVSSHYDPMIAKVITWGQDRNAARLRLIDALAATEVVGPTVNRGFLLRLAADEDFSAARLDTGLIDRLPPEAPTDADADIRALTLAALFVLTERAADAAAAAARSNDPGSPWNRTDCWRLNDAGHQDFQLISGDRAMDVSAVPENGGYRLSGASASQAVSGEVAPDGEVRAEIDGAVITGRVIKVRRQLTVFLEGSESRFEIADPVADADVAGGDGAAFTAPMPGRIVAVNAAPGEKAKAGDVLVVLEAMKMEHAIKAPVDGEVTAVHYGVGDQVDEGAELIAFEEE